MIAIIDPTYHWIHFKGGLLLMHFRLSRVEHCLSGALSDYYWSESSFSQILYLDVFIGLMVKIWQKNTCVMTIQAAAFSVPLSCGPARCCRGGQTKQEGRMQNVAIFGSKFGSLLKLRLCLRVSVGFGSY